jgi:hypothetical protein
MMRIICEARFGMYWKVSRSNFVSASDWIPQRKQGNCARPFQSRFGTKAPLLALRAPIGGIE